jgi:hypothetical protein
MVLDHSAGRSRDQAVAVIAGLDLEAAKGRPPLHDWPRFLANEIELEYRRFLLLLALHPGKCVCPAPLIEAFRRCHIIDASAFPASLNAACDGLTERILNAVPASPGDPVTMALYASEFPGWNPAYWRARSINDVLHAHASRQRAPR